jgi:hypothetical protein
MPFRSSIGIIVVASLLTVAGNAQAHDEAKYPDWKGQWARAPVPGVTSFMYGPPWDTSKPEARGQQAPLREEYQAIFEANLADQAAGGSGTWYGVTCRSHGIPAIMSVFFPMEIVVLPDVTYIIANDVHVYVRRIFTDGREWPANENIIPAYLGGLSIGKWIDEDGDGRYDTLEIETRGFKGPRAVDLSGIPLHEDNQTVVKERISLDKADGNLLHNQVTIIDHAFTHPWAVTKNYRRNANPRPYWPEQECAEGQAHVQIGKEGYMVSGDGYLMPVKKGQPAPDLRYFNPAKK